MFPVGNLFDLREVKRGLTSKTSRLEHVIDLYSPDEYPSNVVFNNKDTWIGKVEEKYFDIVDFADCLKEKDDISEEDVQKIDDWVKKAKTDFKKYILNVNNKCNNVSGQSVGFAGAGASAVNYNNSNDSAISVNAERRKVAEVEVEVDNERISDGVQMLNAEIRKFGDWSEAESYEIELAMRKICSWKT